MKIHLTKIIRSLLFCLSFCSSAFVFAQAPVADFQSCKRVIEQYETVDFEDLSSNSPYAWTWDVLDLMGNSALNSGDVIADPLGNGRNEFSKNPQFQFDQVGCYAITLKATNMVGPSAKTSKTCYIEVMTSSSYYLGYGTYGPKGDNHVYTEYGSIVDDGGRNLNYSNNQGLSTRSFLKITPSNGRNITLKFYQLRLSNTGDSLSIYDADTVVAGKRLAVLTSANNGQSPVFNTSSSKMYVLFKTSSSGSDSGYYAVYYTVNNPLEPISKQIKVVRNTVSLPSVFVNDNPTILIKNYQREWTVNDTLQPAYNNMDTLVHTFYNTNSYKICLTITSCDSTFTNCIQGSNSLSVHAELQAMGAVYPNPFTQQIRIQNAEAAEVQIVDALGKLVYSKKVEANAEIDLHTLEAGVYTLFIQSDTGNKSTKLIKL